MPPAFPTPAYTDGWGNEHKAEPGMDLRDYFAGQALAGLLPTAAAPCFRLNADDCAMTAVAAYAIADAMMTERSRRRS